MDDSSLGQTSSDLLEAIRLHRAGDLDRAAAGYRAVLATGEDATALCNLGSIQRVRGAVGEAEDLLLRAVELQPERSPARLNLANLLFQMCRLDEAGEAYAEVIRLDPTNRQAKRDLGNVYLALGRDIEGWALYDERPERMNSQGRNLSFPEWRGESLAGKRLIVLAEQGFGDLIFAGRYLWSLGAAHVTFACRPELCRLFSQLPIEVVPWREGISIKTYDYWALPLSLPRWAPPVIAPYFSGSPRGAGRIGVAWRGNPLPDPGRSLPEALGTRLLAIPGAISLLPEDSGARDFQDTADLVAGLDAVISVDTAIAHLAGSMGKRAIVLLQHNSADWRWRERSPWYPRVTVVRQPGAGDWAPSIRKATDLVL
ncbi:tetratricopeptide repeat protein [Phenylobacterium sp.]|uniref:tetratricopeptide repeat protein n=1 Tax=Phenylobacterium sp. TaxID=1871053 RepID=UPI00356504A4